MPKLHNPSYFIRKSNSEYVVESHATMKKNISKLYNIIIWYIWNITAFHWLTQLKPAHMPLLLAQNIVTSYNSDKSNRYHKRRHEENGDGHDYLEVCFPGLPSKEEWRSQVRLEENKEHAHTVNIDMHFEPFTLWYNDQQFWQKKYTNYYF